jgi:hypothetical protein
MQAQHSHAVRHRHRQQRPRGPRRQRSSRAAADTVDPQATGDSQRQGAPYRPPKQGNLQRGCVQDEDCRQWQRKQRDLAADRTDALGTPQTQNSRWCHSPAQIPGLGSPDPNDHGREPGHGMVPGSSYRGQRSNTRQTRGAQLPKPSAGVTVRR